MWIPFGSLIISLVLWSILVFIFRSISELANLIVLGFIAPLSLLILILGIFAATIQQLKKKNWLKFSINVALFFLSLIIAYNGLRNSAISPLAEWSEIEGCSKRISIAQSFTRKFQNITIQKPNLGKREIPVSGCIEDLKDQELIIKLTDSLLNSGGFKPVYNFECRAE